MANRWCRELNQYIKLDNRDRKLIDKVIMQMYDDYLSFRMTWTRTPWICRAERYIDELGDLMDDHPDPEKMVQAGLDNIVDHLEAHLDLPTWNVVSMTVRHGYIKLELGEDYRILDWTKKFGASYGS